jgi:plastocyanin
MLAVTAVPVPLNVIGAHQRHHAVVSHSAVRAAGDPASTQATTTATTQTTTAAPTTTTASTTTSSTTTTAAITTSTTTTAAATAAPAATTPAASTQSSQDQVLKAGQTKPAHAAGDPGVTIVDFSFSPGSITVHVGDTVTWTNNGKQPHTATANDGSFNTPQLKNGQSASHTFTKAGTFAYICAIHPFMKGTVVVEAASTTPSSGGSGSGSGSSGSSGTSGGSGSSSTGTGTATSAQATTSSGPTLPVTGLSLASVLVAAAALIGGGLVLRRRARV